MTLLGSLYELAKQESLVEDPDFVLIPVAWLARVNSKGIITSIDDNRVADTPTGKRKPRLRARSVRIPRQPQRTRAAIAAFMCDKSEYAFGLAVPSSGSTPRDPEELKARASLFRSQVELCVAKTGDIGATALLQALTSLADGTQTLALPSDCASNDLFAFVYQPDIDLCVHERPAVAAYWKTLRNEDDAPISSDGFTCLVTGVPVSEPANFPKVKRVPGGMTSGVPLVSFNSPAFESYGWKGNENAPISRAAAEACSTALERLIHPAFPNPSPDHQGETLKPRNVRLGSTTLVTYWASSEAANEEVDMFGVALNSSGDPEIVGELYRSWRKGHRTAIEDTTRFYALTLSGAQGRMVVRDWFETSLATAQNSLADYFDDLRIVRNTPAPRDRPLSPIPALDALIGSLAPFGNQNEVPVSLAAAFVSAAIRGTPFPIAVLQRALERARAEIGQDSWADLNRRDARAALIKAVLLRRRRIDPSFARYPEPTEAMDPNNQNPGYLLGRLMANLERLQQAALGNPNASVVDRYFSAASARPRGVFVRLLKNARHHARKAQEDDNPSIGRLARWLDRQVDDIADRFDPRNNGFPAALSVEEQGMFVLGYHQQRHWLRLSKEERDAATAEQTAA
jgi:CRISPR-associated protein Csd1